VGDLGVEPEDLGLAVGGVQLDGQGYLPEFDGKTGLARRVEHLRELLLDRRAALVPAADELARGGAADGERVDAGLGVEAVVFLPSPGENARSCDPLPAAWAQLPAA